MQGTSREEGIDWADSGTYEQLRRAATTHREDLVIRLGGEVGLRPLEMSQLTPGHIHTHGEHYFLTLPERLAYLPPDVEHAIRKYVGTEGISSDEGIFDVTPRRLQMLIREVAERASDTTGNERLEGVSSRDLQDRFARSMLVERGIPLRIVHAIDGRENIESLRSYLEPVEMDDIVAAFDRNGNEGSGQLHQLVEVAADLGEELATASTQTEIQTAVCDRLSTIDDCRFVWTGDVVGDKRVIPQARDGVENETIETFLTRHDEQLSQTIASRNVQVLTSTNLSVPEHAAHVLVPIVTGDTVRGMFGIGTESNGFEPRERDFLAAVGVQIGHALGAVEHKRLLLADSVIELTIQSTDDRGFFAAASAALGCTFRLSGLVPIEGDALLCFVVVTGSTPDAVLTFVDDASGVDRARLIRDHGDSALIECTVTDDPAVVAARSGNISELVSEKGQERLVSEVATDANTRSVIDNVTSTFPDSYLLAKREREKPVETKVGLRESLSELLTPKQESALRVAYLGGYFEWPRGSTAEELADSMDVSSPTLHNHLRNAQQKLLTAFFDSEGSP
jgi:predicted DNA binding protein